MPGRPTTIGLEDRTRYSRGVLLLNLERVYFGFVATWMSDCSPLPGYGGQPCQPPAGPPAAQGGGQPGLSGRLNFELVRLTKIGHIQPI